MQARGPARFKLQAPPPLPEKPRPVCLRGLGAGMRDAARGIVVDAAAGVAYASPRDGSPM